VAAGCTAFSAYLIGDVINQAYVNRSLTGIIVIGAITVVLFSMKGLATYGHSVMLSRIGNRIVADNQRAVFSKLLNEGLGFFADRHSSEFIARLSTGAAAATQVINLLITSVGRDLLSADRVDHGDGGAGSSAVVFQLCRGSAGVLRSP
jgi:ATP-binding cassette subfamily B protein